MQQGGELVPRPRIPVEMTFQRRLPATRPPPPQDLSLQPVRKRAGSEETSIDGYCIANGLQHKDSRGPLKAWGRNCFIADSPLMPSAAQQEWLI